MNTRLIALAAVATVTVATVGVVAYRVLSKTLAKTKAAPAAASTDDLSTARAHSPEGVTRIEVTTTRQDALATAKVHLHYNKIAEYLKREFGEKFGTDSISLIGDTFMVADGLVAAELEDLILSPEAVMRELFPECFHGPVDTTHLWVSLIGEFPIMVYIDGEDYFAMFCRPDGTFVTSGPMLEEYSSIGYLDVVLGDLMETWGI